MAFLLINPSGFQDWPPCPAGTDGRLVTGNPLEDWRRCSGWTERAPVAEPTRPGCCYRRPTCEQRRL